MDSQDGGQPGPAQTSLAMDFNPRRAGWYIAQQEYDRIDTNHAPADIFQKQLQPHVNMNERATNMALHSTDMPFTPHQISGTIDSSPGSFIHMQLPNIVGMSWPPGNTRSDPGPARENYRVEGDVENTQAPNLTLGFSDPTRGLPILGQQNGEPRSSTQPVSSMPAKPMPPSAQPRKRKAPTLREEAFAPHKDRILQLHLDMRMTLPQVRKTMEEECGLKAEVRQYRSQISRWGKDKNVKPREMKAIVRKRQRRKLIEPHKNELVFRVRGSQVPTRKIERWMKGQNLSDSLPYSPSPSAPTPSDVECRTISEGGSPAPISMHSPTASDIIPLAIPPRISSPEQSIPNIFCPPSRVFTGKSLTLTYRPLANSYSGFYRMNRFNARPRYRQTDEEFLRSQIARASLSDRFGITEPLELYLDLGLILLQQARYKSAHELISKVANNHRSWSGNDNKYTLSALCLLSVTLRFQGSYTKAERVCRRALVRCNEALGQGHLCTLGVITELGLTLSCQYRDVEAEAMHRQALKDAQKFFKERELVLSEKKSKLAKILWLQDKYEEAEVLYRQALPEIRRNFGRGRPQTLNALHDFAAMRWYQGMHQEAEAIFQKVLSLSVTRFGAEHGDSLSASRSIGLVWSQQGKHQEAEAMYRQVAEGLSQVLGEKDARTLDAFYELGRELRRQNRYEEAEGILRQVLEGYIEVLGEKHIDTLDAFYELGRELRRQNRYEEAEGILRQVLEGYIEVLGEKHIDTLRVFCGLGQVFRTQNRFEEAEAMFLKELEGCKEVLEARHPDTLSTLEDLEYVLKSQGKNEEAEAIRRWLFEE